MFLLPALHAYAALTLREPLYQHVHIFAMFAL